MGDIGTYTDTELLQVWESERDMTRRDAILTELQGRRLFPTAAMDTWEHEAGLYPDSDDPRFIEKLMEKQEFIENRQESLGEQQKRGEDLCNTGEEFELTSVQRFISRFLSPQCPYQSALLYHGVGVGKTCAAITTAEEYLRTYPKETVFIVAPRNIQPGFRRTIFDEETLVITKSRTVANSANGCTGNSYIQRTGTEYEIDKPAIIRRINQSINGRYRILGYIQFWRYIQEIIDSVQKTADPVRTQQEQTKALRRAFDGRLIIIDEAHNLRDSPGETADDNLDAPGGDVEMSESNAGKRLTPTLLRMLSVVQGMKLMLLTGTPMYNSYKEIVFLLNLLLRNDKKATLSEREIFDPTGKFRRGGEKLLGGAASAYLSFMRGENPLTFPVRLEPRNVPRLLEWPKDDPQGDPLPTDEASIALSKKTLLHLPFVPISFEGEELTLIRSIADTVIETSGGLGLQSLDEMVQSGNWLFPATDGDTGSEFRIRDNGFNTVFNEKKEGVATRFESKMDSVWLTKGPLKSASPKADFILNRIAKTKGVIFIYSRFIKSGALPMALALEANGYSPWGINRPLLTNPNLEGKGRQCAFCEVRERAHKGQAHPFSAAKYVLLTGQAALSPNNAAAVKASRAKENLYGKDVKVIIGSQVASEGIDLRFVREIYVFDSWFHLNKMEQVLGRGVRTCSHSLLPAVERNCTIHLLVNTYGTEATVETADLYMYRKAMDKAIQIGRVTRVLKSYALDCNLNISANYVSDLAPIDKLEDAQGFVRENIELNDTPYTSICDWTECPYSCAKSVDLSKIIKNGEVDMSTYDEYAMRWRESQIKQLLKRIFEEEKQPNIQAGALEDSFHEAGIPNMAIKILLANIVGNQSFRVQLGNEEGYILYRNGFYLFQPIRLADVRIPLALRVADVPIGWDEFTPIKVEYVTKDIGKGAETATKVATDAILSTESIPVKKAEVKPPTVAALAYWKACIAWAKQIREGERILDIPPECKKVLDERYTGDMYKREANVLAMISWMYEIILNGTGPEYAADKQVLYRTILADVFLEIIWDESITPLEQLEIVSDPANLSVELDRVTNEQILKKKIQGVDVNIFRYVNPRTGFIEYICGKDKCSQAVIDYLEKDKTDPVNLLEANRDTTGPIYGFIIPKLKEAKFILKTNDRPVNKGVAPEKGKECENVSTIAGHKDQLVAIRHLLDTLGYPPFLLIDAVLNEKDQRVKVEAVKTVKKRKDEDEGVLPMEREMKKVKEKLFKDARKFQNVIKACALKNIILRMIDELERKAKRKRYFYRPIAAIKSRHKLK